MCHLVREASAAGDARSATQATPPLRVPPRWAGALGAALVGGLALAALVTPAPVPQEASVQPPAAAVVPVVLKTEAVPTATSGAGPSPGVDDGVPTSPDVRKAAGLGGCHHEL
jgi:hypothetical protein